MDKTKKKNNRLYFFFSLVCTLLLSACGIRNHNGFYGEDARFANYTLLGTDGDGTSGLAYYEDETNPNEIAVAVGSCTDQNIEVTTYKGRNVTSVFPAGFQNCETIRTITLPDTITSFGTDAFAGSSLQSITIPNGLSVISSGAFRNCKDLVVVDFDKDENTVTTINDYAFANDYSLSTFPFHKLLNLKSIGAEAFLYCLELRSVIFPKGFTTLQSYAFQDCKGLTTIYFPNSIVSIGESAFRGVGNSARIYFADEREDVVDQLGWSDPNPGTTIPFEDAHNFSYGNYHLPISFGVGDLIISGPFHFSRPETGTYPLEEYTGTGNGTWRDEGRAEYTETIAEDEVILYNYEDDGRASLDIPSTIDWGETLKVVGIQNNVFKDKTTFSSVTFHENLRFIDAFAFQGCTSLDEIDLQGAVDLKHIQAGAFYNTMPTKKAYDAEHKNEIHIPANVENIGPGAFGSCDGLFRLHFDGTSNTYEETFYSPGGTSSFELPYKPVSVTSVTVNGPTKAYTVNDKTIQISGGNVSVGSVIKVKYETNSTTTQTFTGHKDGVNLVSQFVLSGKAEAIGSVYVDGVAQTLTTDYTVENIEENTKTKITFTTAPGDGKEIIVSYRSLSKLQKIDEYAFYGCADNYSGSKFDGYSYNLRECLDPFQSITFPASLTEIGENAFGKAEFIGETVFQSSTLSIKASAFQEHKCLSSIIFPTTMTGGLNLYNKSFASGLGTEACAAGNEQKKLISVTLPANTTVWGDNVFDGHLYVSIYCINNTPTIKNNKTAWHKVGNVAIGAFGDFSGAASKTEFDYAAVYTVASANDIITIPNKENPVFDFVKQKGQTSATLTNYHFYGGRIRDAAGNTAITMGNSLATTNTSHINSNYNSEYAVKTNYAGNVNGHFRLEVPYQVYINGSWLDVETIGKKALALQINVSNLHPKNDAGKGRKTSSNGCYYWQENKNFFTMREVSLPNTIVTIDEASFALIPFTTLKSYDGTSSKTSADGLAKIYDDSTNAISAIGVFPSSLKTIGNKAFVFSGITHAILPAALTRFGAVTQSAAPNPDTSYYYFPFMGCFDLTELSMTGTAANPVFTASGGVLMYASNNQMIEGAEGATAITIPWGTTSMVAGAIRGGRGILDVSFPYTLQSISNNFLDAIGTARDSSGRSGVSELQSVEFKSAAEMGAGPTSINTPQCTSIGKSAFYGCGELVDLELPDSLQYLGVTTFYSCSKLNNITIDKGTAGTVNLGAHLDFRELPNLTSVDTNCFELCTALRQVTTSSALTTLSSNVFLSCSGIQTATFDSALTKIDASCFSGCTSLANVTFNGTGVTFANSCFNNCDALTNIDIPDDSTLNNQVFNSCNGLDNGRVLVGTGVTFTGTKGNSAFKDCDAGTKIFLMENEATYKTRKNAGKYPEGWNVRSWSGNSGSALDFYCLNDAESDTPGDFAHWHYVDGVPTPW